ncbi:uncharacterized protein VTP21DRAFT_8957 [Calcarisporiella thermophila]|uniref:uncharacterized protein n=1 Tax=Calcarisporiella thermophila TaxID=911321 RepID=UPI003743049D
MQQPPSYNTPTNFHFNDSASRPSTASASTDRNRNLDEEIKLYTNSKGREKYETMADLYAIIVTVEHLEKAYIRDSITPQDYTPACARLIAQFKTALNLVRDAVPDVEQFMREYKLECPAAANRLLKIGVPATIEHAAESGRDPSRSAKYVAETVQHFITLMDALKLNFTAVDQLHPQLSDLMQSLHYVSLPPEFEDSKEKLRNWLITLNQMKASDTLGEDDVRQLMFDLENAHNLFYRSLSDRG